MDYDFSKEQPTETMSVHTLRKTIDDLRLVIAQQEQDLTERAIEVKELRLKLNDSLRRHLHQSEWTSYAAQLLERISRTEAAISDALGDPAIVTRSVTAAAQKIRDLREQASRPPAPAPTINDAERKLQLIREILGPSPDDSNEYDDYSTPPLGSFGGRMRIRY